MISHQDVSGDITLLVSGIQGADNATVLAALTESEVRLMSAGETLLKPGDANNNIYVLLSGKLGAYPDSKDDPDVVIPILPGECIGELFAIDGKPESAYVVALSDVRLLRLTQEMFWDRLMIIPGVARNMMMHLSERMRRTNETVLEHLRKQQGEITSTDNAHAPPKKMLGMFELDAEIGKGAMGTVYSGRDTISGRAVAIKTMLLAGDLDDAKKGEAEKRFLREAKILTWLDHPGIVTIYDVGHENGMAYIAMEFLKGVELSRHIEPGSLLPLAKTLDIIARVAEALDYAHEQGVIHRDVKPGNFMYDPDSDIVKVTDFGISKLEDSSKTKVGVVMGSPFYMAPEQVFATGVSGRSDIFSLGTSLYRMVSGAYPFNGEAGHTVMYRIVKDPHQDIKTIKPDLPDSVCEVINRALAKKPANRYQRGHEMAEALRRCLADLK